MATKIIGVQDKQVSGAGDDITISAGSGNTSGAGGNITITPGAQAVTGGPGKVVIDTLTVGRGASGVATNTAVGVSGLAAITSGANNVGVGNSAAAKLTTSSDSVFVGSNAGKSATTGGGSSVYIGSSAGSAVTTGGGSSVFIGHQAGGLTTTAGSQSVGVGYRALYGSNSAQDNTAIGYEAGYYNYGSANAMLGSYAGFNSTGASNNIFIGYSAGSALINNSAHTTPAQCIYIGTDTRGFSNSDSNAVVIGNNALSEGSNAVVIGNSITTKCHLYGATHQMGSGGAITISPFQRTTSGAGNDITIQATDGFTSGAGGNITITPGEQAATGGPGKVVIDTLTVGRGKGGVSTNTAVGVNALRDNGAGGNSTIVGWNAGVLGTGSTANNTFIGSMSGNQATGSNNTFIGHESGYAITTGTQNVCVGRWSGRYLANGSTSLSTTSNSIYIGHDSRGTNSDSNSIVIGYQCIGEGANTTVIGNSSTVQQHLYATYYIKTEGSLAFAASTPTAITASQNDYVLTGSAFQRLNCTSASNITGIAPPSGASHTDGRVIWLHNIGAANLTLKHSVTSTAANQLITPTSGDMVLGPNRIVLATYDATSTKWRLHGETYPYIYPTTDGSNNQVLTTNGSGTLSWSTVSSGGSGTVTSVGLSLPNIFSVSGSPVQSSGTLTGTLANQNANLVFAGPSGGAATTPAFRSLVASDLPTITSLGTVTSGTWNATTIGIAYGGTGQTTAASAYNALTPITSLGDLVYGSGTNAATRLAGNTTATKNFLSQTGTGSVSAAPSWSTVSKSDVGLGNVENTAFSTWAGTSSITTLGTIATGTWSATAIAANKGGTGQTGYTAGDLLYASGTTALTKLGIGSSGQVLTSNGSAPTWVAGGTYFTSSTTAPSSPIAGSRWWNTSLGILYTYDGTQWLEM
jgi:hypothetical protein